jgi:hypothetical protein
MGLFRLTCGSAGIRTQDPYIKSVLLYQLSYRTDTFVFTTAVCYRVCGYKSTATISFDQP